LKQGREPTRFAESPTSSEPVRAELIDGRASEETRRSSMSARTIVRCACRSPTGTRTMVRSTCRSPMGARMIERSTCRSPMGARTIERSTCRSPMGARMIERSTRRSPMGARMIEPEARAHEARRYSIKRGKRSHVRRGSRTGQGTMAWETPTPRRATTTRPDASRTRNGSRPLDRAHDVT